MTDSYQASLQSTATQVWEQRREYERVNEEHRRAASRLDELGKRLMDLEAELCRTVGANQPTKMWLVATGVAVVVSYRDSTRTVVSVHDAEPQE